MHITTGTYTHSGSTVGRFAFRCTANACGRRNNMADITPAPSPCRPCACYYLTTRPHQTIDPAPQRNSKAILFGVSFSPPHNTTRLSLSFVPRLLTADPADAGPGNWAHAWRAPAAGLSSGTTRCCHDPVRLLPVLVSLNREGQCPTEFLHASLPVQTAGVHG